MAKEPENADDKEVGADEAVVELTEREIAIAKGEDPGDVDDVIVDDDAAVDGGEDAGGDAEDGEVGETDEGKDADAAGKSDTMSETWVTDEIKQLAGTYGLADADLADFDDERDFLRFARVLEKRGGVAKPTEGDAKKETVAESDGKSEKDEHVQDIPKIDPEAYKKAGYEDEVVNLARVAAMMQERLDAIAPVIQRQQQLERQQVVQAFDAAADTLGRYGKAGSLNDAEIAKRSKLWDTARLVEADLQQRGIPTPSLAVLLRRAEIVAFGDEILAEKKAKLADSVKKQSAKRRPVGRNVARQARKPAADGADDPVSAIANAPELAAFWAENSTD